MPYKLKKVKGGYKVGIKGRSKTFSKKPLSKEQATKQLAAIEINTHNESLKSFREYFLECLHGGEAEGMSIEDIAKKHDQPVTYIEQQLAAGIKVEMEHTNDTKIAEQIAMDHLSEDCCYYKKLKKAGL